MRGTALPLPLFPHVVIVDIRLGSFLGLPFVLVIVTFLNSIFLAIFDAIVARCFQMNRHLSRATAALFAN